MRNMVASLTTALLIHQPKCLSTGWSQPHVLTMAIRAARPFHHPATALRDSKLSKERIERILIISEYRCVLPKVQRYQLPCRPRATDIQPAFLAQLSIHPANEVQRFMHSHGVEPRQILMQLWRSVNKSTRACARARLVRTGALPVRPSGCASGASSSTLPLVSLKGNQPTRTRKITAMQTLKERFQGTCRTLQEIWTSRKPALATEPKIPERAEALQKKSPALRKNAN
jgi:hypothetical protein